MPTLLEKAKQKIQRKDIRTLRNLKHLQEKIDLALAYSNGEIDSKQAWGALDCKKLHNVNSILGQTLIVAARHGLIKITKV